MIVGVFVMLRFAFTKFRALWLALVIGMAALPATPASAQADPRWGYLAELAEHDFEYGVLISTWRWKVPNQILAQTT